MGTQTIITTNAIEQLEDDISELTAKLNGVITEYNLVQADMTSNKTAIDQLKTQFNLAESDLTNHKGKIDTLIIDVNNIEMFKSRIYGLVSHYKTANKDLIPEKFNPGSVIIDPHRELKPSDATKDCKIIHYGNSR